MDNTKVINLGYNPLLKSYGEEIQLIRRTLQGERLKETRKEMEQLVGIEERALELEMKQPENIDHWSKQLRLLLREEIEDDGAREKAEAILAIISRALHAEEWHALYRELAFFCLVLLEQLEYSRGVLTKIGLDSSPMKPQH